ncbi:FxsA family protein [Futiania mangrovi]|uniref:FxsA family protein n=1 Tax=Futiania mangrovi TaxID=2959716 RepID=A0A9J6PK92_9PROT|nr:FxsA family protein [Futiania mangrovii]MCP1336490.1 FxsA family protein [Futiania mangrovii]
MARLALIAFIAVPLIEIALFIQVGGLIGLWPTLAIIVLTAVIGVALLRQQGLSTLTRAQARMDRGEMPVREMLEGILLAIAGALLLTPGFFTDAIGFALLVPAVRQAIGNRIARHVVVSGPQPAPPHRPKTGSGGTIEGDYEVVGEGTPPGPATPREDSPWRGT